MKFLLLALILCVAVAGHISASRTEDLLDRLFDVDDESEVDDFFDRRNKGYLSAPKHPQRLRDCIKCVGKERDKGSNVKQATSRCNQICKRDLFDTRSLQFDDLED